MQSFAIDRGSVTILNVDDEAESRRTTTRVLARAGYRVVEAARGLEAIALVRDRAPELALLDVDLPDVSGLDVCRQVKGSAATDATIVVYLTTASSAAETVRGLLPPPPRDPGRYLDLRDRADRLRAARGPRGHRGGRIRRAPGQACRAGGAGAGDGCASVW